MALMDLSGPNSTEKFRVSKREDVPMSGQRRAIRELARVALGTSTGERLPTAHVLQDLANVGAGTVQKALRILEELGALQTRARGHMGRFLEGKDLSQLWGLSGFPSIRAILSPPGSPETYGLADGLAREFSRIGLPLNVEYLIGARERANLASSTPYTLAFVSSGAASALEEPPQGWGRVQLGAGSYYRNDSIVVLSSAEAELTSKAIRIGVDRRSHDHNLLTVQAFGPLNELRTVDVAFPDIPGALLRGDIDAGVWHRMLLVITPELAGLRVSPLPVTAQGLVKTLGSAVALFGASDAVMESVVSAVSWRSVVATQRNWMDRFAGDPTATWFR